MEPQNTQPDKDKQSTKAYGKRPLWQWIVIYAIVAVVVYGLIYLLFIRDGSGY